MNILSGLTRFVDWKTVKTVLIANGRTITPLKRGVNEKRRISLSLVTEPPINRLVETEREFAVRSLCMNAFDTASVSQAA